MGKQTQVKALLNKYGLPGNNISSDGLNQAVSRYGSHFLNEFLTIMQGPFSNFSFPMVNIPENMAIVQPKTSGFDRFLTSALNYSGQAASIYNSLRSDSISANPLNNQQPANIPAQTYLAQPQQAIESKSTINTTTIILAVLAFVLILGVVVFLKKK